MYDHKQVGEYNTNQEGCGQMKEINVSSKINKRKMRLTCSPENT
jgi:hypothetical protein